MAVPLMSLEEVCQELQMTQDEVTNLVTKGLLRGFRDANTYKFRRADIDAYKKTAQTGATVMVTGEEDDTDASDVSDSTDVAMNAVGEGKDDTSKIDLADIESEPGAEESDQTSVLAPVEESEEEAQKEEKAEFDFSEEELGLSLEEEPGESVLVADESESSVDILDTAEESSSDSVTTDSELALLEESSEEEASPIDESAEVVVAPEEGAQPAAGETVTDILGSVDDVSDDALETLDIEEAVETPDTGLETATAEARTETAETVPVADEVETVGITADATQGVAEAALPEAVEAEEIPEISEEEAFAVEPAAEEVALEAAKPSVVGIGFLILAILSLALAAVFVLAEMSGSTNVITDKLGKFMNQWF